MEAYRSFRAFRPLPALVASLFLLPAAAWCQDVTFRIEGTLTDETCERERHKNHCAKPFHVGERFVLEVTFDSQAAPTFVQEPYVFEGQPAGGRLVRWDGSVRHVLLTVGRHSFTGPSSDPAQVSHVQVIDNCAACDWFIDLYEMNAYLQPSRAFRKLPPVQNETARAESVFLNCALGDLLSAADTPPQHPPPLELSSCGFALRGTRTRELFKPLPFDTRRDDLYSYLGTIERISRVDASAVIPFGASPGP